VRAAIDVGSTSVHALVAAVEIDGLTALLDESSFLGLGSTVDGAGRLGVARTSELAGVLDAYAGRARALGAASVAVLGTEPLRRAFDAARVVEALARETGLALQVLSQQEEALLTLVGVTGGRRMRGPLVVVDVGGGSTEIISAAPDEPPLIVGLGLGTARLTGRFVTHDPATPGEVQAMVDEASATIASLAVGRPHDVIAVGGTAENLLRVGPGRAGGPDGEGSGTLTRAGLLAALERLASEPAELAAARYGVRPIRARLLPAGAAILLALIEHWAVDGLRVSASGLREGAILTAAQAGTGWRDRLPHLGTGWRD